MPDDFTTLAGLKDVTTRKIRNSPVESFHDLTIGNTIYGILELMESGLAIPPDGSETKVVDSVTVTHTGNGTPATPFQFTAIGAIGSDETENDPNL